MELSPNDFHAEAYQMVNVSLTNARDNGLDISSLPPTLCLVKQDPEFLEFCLPTILQDIDPNFWSMIAHQEMSEDALSIGFVFWCLVQGQDSIDEIFCLSYHKDDGFVGFLSDVHFEKPPQILDDPLSLVPYWSNYDFECPFMEH